MALTPGTVIEGKYRIVRLLGQGGMGAVYEGANTRISRRVAIKVLHTSLAAKETLVRRFEQEAKAAGLIGSEHIVEVLDIGSLPSGELFMVMEFLEGEDLGSRIKKLRRLKPHDAANIVHQLLEGLTAAHKAGIIHRDLKPENVFLLTSWAGRRDFVKVLDFGVSKFSALEGEAMSMTSTGAVVGTPYYLSPEQARGLKNIDARSDLYSVGVVLYQAVTGRLPFNAETFNELVFKIALEEPEPAEIVVPNLDRSFAAIISRAMVRDVNGRFQSAREFQEALEQWMNPSADGARARATAAAAPVVAPAQGAPVGRSGTLAMEQVPAVPLSPPPYPGAPATGPAPPYAMPQAAPGAMRPHAQQGAAAAGMHGGPPAFGAAAPTGFAQPGGYPGTPMNAPQPGATPHGTPMTTPQPGVREIPEGAAAPPNKRGLVVAAALVGVLAIAGGAFGAHLIFGRSNTQGGASATTPQTSATQEKTDPPAPPTAAPSQAPSAETAKVEPTAAPSSTASAPPAASTATAPTPPAPPATNNAGTASAPPKGPFPTPGPSKTIPPTPTAPTPTTPTTAPPKPTGRVINSEL